MGGNQQIVSEIDELKSTIDIKLYVWGNALSTLSGKYGRLLLNSLYTSDRLDDNWIKKFQLDNQLNINKVYQALCRLEEVGFVRVVQINDLVYIQNRILESKHCNKARRDLGDHLLQPFHFTDEETNFYNFDFLLSLTKLQHYLHTIVYKNDIILFTKVI